MAEIETWRAVSEALSADRPVALVVVVDGHGSSPGKPGAMLAVGRTGPLAGTVGGGLGEAQAIEHAMAMLDREDSTPSLLRQRHRQSAEGASGMICGGEQRLAIVPLHKRQQAAVDRLLNKLTDGCRSTWQLSPAGWEAIADSRPAGWREEGAGWHYTHNAGPEYEVWLIGGGHVSLALSGILSGLDFRIVVSEERPGIGSFAANRHAHRRLAVAYEELAGLIPQGETTFVGIMTHAWQRDAMALQMLAGKTFGYLGLLGSPGKLAQLIGDKAQPRFMHAPMGLPIGSHTPEEIAVSIAAQMIAERRRLAGH